MATSNVTLKIRADAGDALRKLRGVSFAAGSADRMEAWYRAEYLLTFSKYTFADLAVALTEVDGYAAYLTMAAVRELTRE